MRGLLTAPCRDCILSLRPALSISCTTTFFCNTIIPAPTSNTINSVVFPTCNPILPNRHPSLAHLNVLGLLVCLLASLFLHHASDPSHIFNSRHFPRRADYPRQEILRRLPDSAM